MIFDIAACHPLVLSYFLPGAPYLDVVATTRSLQVQEMVALIALEMADLKSARRVDILCSKRHRENFGSGPVLGTNFDPRK